MSWESLVEGTKPGGCGCKKASAGIDMILVVGPWYA